MGFGSGAFRSKVTIMEFSNAIVIVRNTTCLGLLCKGFEVDSGRNSFKNEEYSEKAATWK
jgi:hypothetical protein